MPMLAEFVDAVVGVDTHRDTHEVEIASPTGTPIATVTITITISNDSSGFTDLLAWIFQHTPGPRVAVSIEGTRSYGAGLARAVTAAGLLVIECEQPHRKARRGKGKSDPIDAHLAVLTALRLDADRLPTPRADGDREAVRILLATRNELTTTSTGQTNRLPALLLSGDDTDRHTARGTLTETTLASLARRRSPREASREQAVRHAEIRRLALALREAGRALKANRTQLQTIVDELAPGLTDQPGIGPVSAAQVIVSFSHPGRCRKRGGLRHPGRHQPTTSQQRPHHPAPTQPRRRPGPQPRHPHHRHHQDAPLPQDPRLPRAAHRTRQNPPRNPALPQALHRPPALPHPHHRDDPHHPSLRAGLHPERGGLRICPGALTSPGQWGPAGVPRVCAGQAPACPQPCPQGP